MTPVYYGGVRLILTPMLRRYSGGRAEFELAGAMSVGDALDGLFETFPDLRERVLDARGRLHPYLLLYLNEQTADFAATVGAGDIVEIVGAAAGG